MSKNSSHDHRPPTFRRIIMNAGELTRIQPRRFILHMGFGCLFAGTLVTPTRAQDALQSALSIGSILQAQGNSPTEIPPGQPHLGPVQLSLGASSGIQVNDNINLSQTNLQSDAIVSAGLNVGALWPATQQSQLNFSSGVGYSYYLEHPENSYVYINPGSVLNWSVLLEQWTLTLYDQFSYTRNINTVASVSNTSGIPVFDNTIGLRANWQPDHWQIQLGYSYNSNIPTSGVYDYLNYSSDNFFAQGAWRFANSTQLGLEASTSITQYRQNTQANSTSYSLGPYLQWQVKKSISNSLRGGVTYYSFSSTPVQPARTLNSYYFGMDLTHQLTRFVSQTLSAQRNISLGINSGSAYTEQITVNYGVNWFATSWLGVGLNLTYEKGLQPQNGTSTRNEEKYYRYGVSPGLNYQFTKKLSGNLSYSFLDKNSNVNGNNYFQSTLNLQLVYVF